MDRAKFDRDYDYEKRQILRLEKELNKYKRRQQKRRSRSRSRGYYDRSSASSYSESRSRSRDRFLRGRSRDYYSRARSRDRHARRRPRDRRSKMRSRDRFSRTRSRDHSTHTYSRERVSRDRQEYSNSRSRSQSRQPSHHSEDRGSKSRDNQDTTQLSSNEPAMQSTESGNPSNPVSDSSKEKEGGQDSQTNLTAQPTQLDETILKAIGKRLDPDNATGPPIEQEIALRWTEILEKGLPKEEKLELLKKFPTPENCKLINPPKLNPEIKASLPEGAISRDARMVEKQTKLSVCLTALGRAITSLISTEEIDKLKVLELVSDAGRVLSEVQREESLTRKALVLTNLNSNLKETLNATTIGEMLFGKELEGQIKIAKTLERTSKELKSSNKSLKPAKNGQRPSRLMTAAKTQTKLDGPRRSWNQKSTNQRSTYQRSAYRSQNQNPNSTRSRYPSRRH